MADAFTSTTALADQVKTAYDRNAYFALRSGVVFDQLADVKPGNVTSPGSSVQFLFWTEMTAATTALSETVDVDAVALADTTVSVTPSEYGNAVLITLKVQTDTLLVGFDPDVADLVSYNMVDSIDQIARTTFDASGNVNYVTGTTEVEQVAGSIITANKVRHLQSKLRANSVMGIAGDLYGGILHPHVAYDLKKETGDAAWLSPHIYVDTQAVYNNEIGTFAGVKFMETPRASLTADGGSSTVDTYDSYFLGKQAVAKVESIAPHTVIGPVTDTLLRFRPLGWHAYLGYGQFRQNSMERLISSSSIGSNS